MVCGSDRSSTDLLQLSENVPLLQISTQRPGSLLHMISLPDLLPHSGSLLLMISLPDLLPH